VHSGIVRFIRARRFKYLAGQVRMDLEPGRIGFMSTQRRENRWQRISCRVCHGVTEQACFTPAKGHALQTAKVETAPPSTAGLATNSLQSDYRTIKLVRPHLLRSSPSYGTPCRASVYAPALGSSLRHVPFPSGFAPIHPALPQAPTGRRRWAERYDGKRDLHLQHAA
jgi:hypothetical protein